MIIFTIPNLKIIEKEDRIKFPVLALIFFVFEHCSWSSFTFNQECPIPFKRIVVMQVATRSSFLLEKQGLIFFLSYSSAEQVTKMLIVISPLFVPVKWWNKMWHDWKKECRDWEFFKTWLYFLSLGYTIITFFLAI